MYVKKNTKQPHDDQMKTNNIIIDINVRPLMSKRATYSNNVAYKPM